MLYTSRAISARITTIAKTTPAINPATSPGIWATAELDIAPSSSTHSQLSTVIPAGHEVGQSAGSVVGVGVVGTSTRRDTELDLPSSSTHSQMRTVIPAGHEVG